MPKARHPIEEAEIPRILDDACIKRLATTRLPARADLRRFAEGVREAARIYAKDARVPTDNELHAEIAALYRSAERKQYEQVAALLEGLSQKARGLLNRRGARPRLGLELPTANALSDAAQQKKARETVLRLCGLGGKYVEGRRRSSGKRSRTWRSTRQSLAAVFQSETQSETL